MENIQDKFPLYPRFRYFEAARQVNVEMRRALYEKASRLDPMISRTMSPGQAALDYYVSPEDLSAYQESLELK